MDLQTAFDRGFEAVKAYVDAEIGDLKKEIAELKARPSMKYCGVWDTQKVYNVGDFTTDAGSVWHCKDANIGVRPGSSSEAWQLAVKRGNDGRDVRR